MAAGEQLQPWQRGRWPMVALPRVPDPVNRESPRKGTFMFKKLAMGLVLAAAVGCVSSSKYEKKAKEATDLDTKARQQAEEIAALEKKSAELEQQLAAVRKEREELQVRTTALSQEKGELEAKSKEYEQLAGSLKAEIEKGQVEISELRGRMVVKLKDKVLFPSGSAKLNREGRNALSEVASAFKDLEGKSIIVAGYTDDVPVGKATGFEDNWALSTARAAAVVRYLAANGIDPQMLGAAGFSEYRPVAANDSPQGRSQNRRIEIALTAEGFEPPQPAAK
jgi:chemotaxis protein MotB